MSELTEFKCFPLLARETQDLIWSFTFWPQMITFNVVEIATSSQESNLSSIKPFMGYKVTDIQTPAAFFVSKATRALALSQNYQTWKISQPDGKARSFLWNPATDTIFADVSNTKDFDLLDLDTQSVKQIQKLAFPYEFWDNCFKTHSGIHRVAGRVNGRFGQWKRRRSSRVLLRLMRTPSTLRELFIMVDNEFFQKEVEGKMGNQMGWWCTHGAIGTGFYEVMRKVLKLEQDSAKLPKISVASSFEMIWHGRWREHLPSTACIYQKSDGVTKTNVEYAADSRLIYKAWWQWTPDDTQNIDFIVTRGDTITVQVTGPPGSNEATYKSTKQNGDEASDIMAPLDDDNVLKGQNIEWVIERLPGKPGTPKNCQLLNFGTVTFTGCSGSTQMTDTSSFPKNGDAIDILELDESVGASTVTDTSGNGDSFTVTWHRI